MQAAYIEEFGGPEQVLVGDLLDPEPQPGQVLIRNVAAGVGIWDIKLIRGLFGSRQFPHIPGAEAAGVVEHVVGDSDLSAGDEVYAETAKASGGWAEYAVAPVDRAARKPLTASFEESTGLVIGAVTAYEGLVDRANLQSGETVLVTAASGGVGSAAVQIAVAVGARVLAVASASNHEFLRQLGATDVFDYHEPGWTDAARRAVPNGVDLVFDGAGNETRDRAVTLVRPGGRGVFIVGGSSATVPDGIEAIRYSATATTERLTAVAGLVDAGKVRPIVDAVYSLGQARAAAAHVADGHSRGRVALSTR